MILTQFEAEFLRRGLEHAHALGHHLLADAVAGNNGNAIDAIGGHGCFLGAVCVGNVIARSRSGEMDCQQTRSGPRDF